MAFHDVRFPKNISFGARGGPERRTQVVTLDSGREERNASWADSRRSYDASYGIRSADQIAAVVAFFEARSARLHAFRWKDWSDWRSGLPSLPVTPTDQALGAGDGAATVFPLVKRYTSGPTTYTRDITKPVAGTVLVALDGVAQATGWSVDPLTGLVTFENPPGAGVAVAAGFEFDVPVRFDSDRLDLTMNVPHAHSIPSIPIIEVRE